MHYNSVILWHLQFSLERLVLVLFQRLGGLGTQSCS
jgi:hypothetical protein